jgi:hypothetical protein
MMASTWVFVAYSVSVALALLFVYLFHSRWYWHVLSVLAALGVGLTPPLPGLNGPIRDLLYGSVFLFLIVWGCAEPFVHRFHRRTVGHT